MDEFLDPFSGSDNSKFLADQFEKMLANGKHRFFDVEELEELIDYYLEERDSAKAFEVLQIAKSQHPSTLELAAREAELLASVGKTGQALQLLEQVMPIAPNNIDLLLIKASIHSQLGGFNDAINTLLRATEIADKTDLDEIYMSLSFEYQSVVDYDKAILYLQKCLDINPEHDDALYELAYCLDEISKDDEAIAIFQSIIDRNPYSQHAWFNLGTVYAKLDRMEDALTAFDYACVIDEAFSSARFSKGITLVSIGRYDEALTVFKESIGNELISSITHYYIGVCYEKLFDFKAAEDAYYKAVHEDDKLANAWIGLASVKEEQGDLFQAIHHAKKAIAIEDDNQDFWMDMARIQNKIGFENEAISCFEEAVALDESNVKVWLDYSEMLFDHGQIDRANAVMDMAFEALPEECEIYYRFVAYLLKNGQVSDAEEYLQKALDLNNKKLHLIVDYYPDSAAFDIIQAAFDANK